MTPPTPTINSPKFWEKPFYDSFAQNENAMSGKTTPEVCTLLLDSFLVPNFVFELIHVWSVDPRRESLILVDQRGRNIPDMQLKSVIPVAGSLTGEVVETRQPKVFSKPFVAGKRKFQQPDILDKLDISSFISIPIRNSGNPHQVLLVVNLFSKLSILEDWLADPKQGENIQFKGTNANSKKESSVQMLKKYASIFAISVESNLRERAFRMSMSTSYALSRIPRLTDEFACKAFAQAVMGAINCDRVSVYLDNWDNSKVTTRADVWRRKWEAVAEPEVPKSVTAVWLSNREFLAPDVSLEADPELKDEISPLFKMHSILFLPLQDVQGRCKGVVRCQRFLKTDGEQRWTAHYTYDDIAVVEAMERAFAPPLEMLLEAEQRAISLQSLAHELRVPLVALRAVLERMEKEFKASSFELKHPYFNEAGTYTEIMQRLLKELEIVRVGPRRIPLVSKPTKLWTDVVLPAKRFIEPLLRERRMTSIQLQESGFQGLPDIDVDRALLTQVVFNLLDNAIKYYPRDRLASEFLCHMSCEELDGHIEITFRDNSSGINEADASRIFEFGTRGRDAEQSDVQGMGLGLWLSREIVHRHLGELVLLSPKPGRRGAEFLLRLPCTECRKRKFTAYFKYPA